MSTQIAITQNGNGAMLVPANIEQAMRLAEMMAGAKLVPTHLQGKPADCLLVIEQAARWKMSPFAVAQCTSVIQGKLMYEGKLVAAVVNANGGLEERLSFNYRNEGDNRTITVSGKFKDEKEARIIEVTLKDVKTANKMWQTQPDQQLMYSGTRAWARRHAPELMLGVYSPEEFDQNPMVNVTPIVDKETGEILETKPTNGNGTYKPTDPVRPHKDEYAIAVPVKPDGTLDFDDFAAGLEIRIGQVKDNQELSLWNRANAKTLRAMEKERPDLFQAIGESFREMAQALM